MSAQISSMSSKTASRTGISPPVSVGGGRYGRSRRWSMAPEEKFEALVDEFTGRPGITPPGATGGVGRTALRGGGRVFGMFVRGQLVLKLPPARGDELGAGGARGGLCAHKGGPPKGGAGPGTGGGA